MLNGVYADVNLAFYENGLSLKQRYSISDVQNCRQKYPEGRKGNNHRSYTAITEEK
jgi:hypothetical protein